MSNTKRDKYDEVATEIYRDLDLDGQEDFDRVLTILRSAFPPPAEDARQCARSVQSHGITFHKNAKGEPVMYDRITKSIDEAAAEISRFAESRVEPWRYMVNELLANTPWQRITPATLEKARALLASSPAPKTFDEAIAQAGGTGIAEFERKAPAPEAPK